MKSIVVLLTIFGLSQAGEYYDFGKCELPQSLIAANRESFCLLGLKSGYIKDHALSASTYFAAGTNDLHSFTNGRLDWPFIPGVQNGAWSSQINAAGQWIQVRLDKPTKIYGVITQGRNRLNQWVRSFKIQFVAPFENNFRTVRDAAGQEKVFIANSDQNTKVTNIFPEPIVAIRVRLVAQTWNGHISLRHDYLVC